LSFNDLVTAEDLQWFGKVTFTIWILLHSMGFLRIKNGTKACEEGDDYIVLSWYWLHLILLRRHFTSSLPALRPYQNLGSNTFE